MCLMCEWYFDSCDKEECYNAATDSEEKWTQRNGYKLFLHKGISGPCKHMLEEHDADCAVVKKQYDEKWKDWYYDSCDCDGL